MQGGTKRVVRNQFVQQITLKTGKNGTNKIANLLNAISQDEILISCTDVSSFYLNYRALFGFKKLLI